MRARKLTFAALAVVAGLSLTACQNEDDAMGQTDPSSASSASSSGGDAASGSSGQDGGKGTAAPADSGSGSGGNGQVAKCRTDGLEITALDTFIDGDPDGSVAVEMKNTSGQDCMVSGFAGVDLKTNAGPMSADRKGEPADPYVLKNGKTIGFSIGYPLNETGGSGVRITGLVVTPPGETKSVTLAWPGRPSLPVTDGSDSGSALVVGPMGSAGQGD